MPQTSQKRTESVLALKTISVAFSATGSVQTTDVFLDIDEPVHSPGAIANPFKKQDQF
jgi:hypothetical protein